MLRKPLIVTDSFHMWIEDPRAYFLWPFSKLACSYSTLVAVPSLAVYKFWESAGIPKKKIRINQMFTSLLTVTENAVSEAKAIKKKMRYKKTVLFVGRLIKEKGVDYLIQAFSNFSEFDNVGLLIVGDGPERSRLEAMCEKLKLSNVTFIWQSDKRIEIAPYFLLCDFLVLPSVTAKSHEEWGLVVNEAMSIAKPVIVSNAVGCAFELVKDGINGFIVPEKNSEALFEAMKRLLAADELRLQMGLEAKKLIFDKFTYRHTIMSTVKLLLDALKL